MVLVQVFFGFNYLAATLVLREMPPRSLAALRATGAAILLLVLARALGRRLPRSPGDLGRLALFAVLGVGLNQVLFMEGLARTTPTHSSLINATIPVNTLLLAVLVGREQLNVSKCWSVLVAFSGVLLLIGPAALDALGRVVTGDLLTLANALSFSLFLVLSKPLLGRVDALAATAVLMLFGAVWIDLTAIPQLAQTDLATVSSTAWLLIAYIIVFPTALAYVMQYWALARVDSSVVAFFIYLQPVIATTLSVVLLHERPGFAVLCGGALIFLGVYLALRPRLRAVRG